MNGSFIFHNEDLPKQTVIQTIFLNFLFVFRILNYVCSFIISFLHQALGTTSTPLINKEKFLSNILQTSQFAYDTVNVQRKT